jgi:zinc transporter
MQHATQGYGSDQSGLVCGYLFGRAPDCKGVALDTEQACRWLAERGAHPQEFIWLHFNLANTASEK